MSATTPPGTPPPIGAVVHPVALYDLLSVTVLFFVLIWFLRGPRAAGSAAALFTLWYAGGRVGLDFLRTDPTRAFGLIGTQLASVVVIVATGAWLLVRARRRGADEQATKAAASGALASPASAGLAASEGSPGQGAEDYDTP